MVVPDYDRRSEGRGQWTSAGQEGPATRTVCRSGQSASASPRRGGLFLEWLWPTAGKVIPGCGREAIRGAGEATQRDVTAS
jgi:hypothetical protein